MKGNPLHTIAEKMRNKIFKISNDLTKASKPTIDLNPMKLTSVVIKERKLSKVSGGYSL